MMNGTIAGFALSTVLLAACSAGGAPDSVDRMARSEVEAIVQEYLTENPEVLQAALVAAAGAAADFREPSGQPSRSDRGAG